MKYALTFPGQGSQSVGMLQALAAQYTQVQETFAECSDAVGYDLWQLAQEGPAEKLNQTQFTQPALLAADVAVFRAWQSHQLQAPAFMAGHSLGEYAALVCAESLGLADATKLVALRGQAMSEAVPAGQGAMAAIIGMPDDKLEALCKELSANGVISPANFNSIGQTVVAGDKALVEECVAKAKEHGAKLAKLIPVSVPSHCDLMASAQDKLAQALADIAINAPTIPVIQNADVQSHQDPAAIKQNLVAQLVSPVRWVETVQYFVQQDVAALLECGPGKVLTGLAKRIDKSLQFAAIGEPEALATSLQLIGE